MNIQTLSSIRFKRLRSAAAGLLLLLAACSSFVPSPTPTLSSQEIKGRSVFDSFCARCHSTIKDSVIVGPSLAGIATRGGQRTEGMDAQAYIRNSIISPGDYTVEGYPEGVMPNTLRDELSNDELEAVIAYLLTLK